MRLHGIELAKPDEWWVAKANGLEFYCYEQVEAEPVRVDGYEALDLFVLRSCNSWVCAMGGELNGYRHPEKAVRVFYGPTGMVLGAGDTVEDAIVSMRGKLAEERLVRWHRYMVGWLETHPLSPRYRYIGTQEQDSA